jgi:hypothetical protein
MQTTNTEFQRLLTKIMHEEMEKFSETMTSGLVMSFEDYKYECGRMAGFRLVLGYFDEVNKLLDEK